MSDENQTPTPVEPTLDDVVAKYISSEEAGQPVDRDNLLAQYPHCAEELRLFFEYRAEMQRLAELLLDDGRIGEHPLGKVRYFGDYELLEEIAAGGMGIVYKARQRSLSRIVAVKMILKGTFAREQDVKRFRAEAEAAANLQHPAIVAIHEVGLHRGHHYFSMDYVDGRSLAELAREQPLSAPHAAEYIRDVAEAVHYAHQQGTLHRDLKPSNILIDRQGRVRITDFGLAKKIASDSDLTLTGQILGTPSYMPPEQASGRRSLVAAGSDIYSLGAVLYELLTGRPPFRGESPVQTLRQVETLDPVPPRLLNPATPRDLETICLKCLEKEPQKRYGTAQLLADDLGRYLRMEPILARPISHPARAWRWCRRNSVVAGLVATVALCLIGGTVVSSHFAMRERVQRMFADEKRMEVMRESLLLMRSRGEIKSAAFSPDGKQLAAASSNNTLQVWDAATAEELLTLKGHTARVVSVAYSPDGKQLASASRDKTVRVWSAATGEELLTLKGHTGAIHIVTFSPDGQSLASASVDRTVKIWNATTGDELCTLGGHPWDVDCVVFSPDGRRLASMSLQTAIIWDAATGRELLTVKLHPDVALGAIQNYRQVILAEPDNYVAHDWLGKGLLAHGEVDRAIGSFRESVRLNPQYARGYTNLGIALGNKGDREGAIAAYQKALEVDPGFSEADSRLKLILPTQVEPMR